MITAPPKLIQSPTTLIECCMCGDSGLSSQLFQCKICQFRSQHRYCSNLYPKAESYQVCNWCLSNDPKEKSQNSSSSNKNSSEDDDSKKNSQNKKKTRGLLKTHQSPRGNLQLQVMNSPIKKQKSPERSSPVPVLQSTTRRRLVSNGRLEEIKLIRRTKSEEINKNNGIIKQVFRNKVRRYKLLDEVSS
ncbi:uncharacterized protein LOC126677188 [Mercurialis annua]|uniref:uncharacterized protein LOC126677188 n=1 Tax=Mercurialis annua TaxID=3986 RepID=UPI002160F2FA|nr:uncharacterized protein LOC126677188 [Mercurialis annua]